MELTELIRKHHPELAVKLESPQFILAELLIGLKMELKLDQQEMAERAGIDFATYRQMEYADLSIPVSDYEKALVSFHSTKSETLGSKTDTLDHNATRRSIEQKETYVSKWIDDTDEATEQFINGLEPQMERFEALKKEGYRVSVDIDERFDSDCFGDRDVVKVMISLYAEKRLTGMPNEYTETKGEGT